MDLNNVDNELNVKILEVFKLILKNENTTITFEQNSNLYADLTYVSNAEHNFILYNSNEELFINELNYKYYLILPTKIRKQYTNLTDENLINYVKNKKRYRILKPFLGEIFTKKQIFIKHNKINYNNVVINLNQLDYDKMVFYTRNVYKLQQLYKLNKELNIDQKFNIIFEDEKVKNELYSSFYISFKDIIKPPENN